MRRHDLDPVSLLWGLFFLGVAVTVLVAEGNDRDIDGGWVLAAALVAVGGVGLTVAAAGVRRRRDREPAGVAAGPMFAPDGASEERPERRDDDDTQVLADGRPESSG